MKRGKYDVKDFFYHYSGDKDAEYFSFEVKKNNSFNVKKSKSFDSKTKRAKKVKDEN